MRSHRAYFGVAICLLASNASSQELLPASRIDILKQIAAANEANFRAIKVWEAEYECEQVIEPPQDHLGRQLPKNVMARVFERSKFVWDVPSDRLLVTTKPYPGRTKFYDDTGQAVAIPDRYQGISLATPLNVLYRDGVSYELFTEFERGPLSHHPSDPFHKLNRLFGDDFDPNTSRVVKMQPHHRDDQRLHPSRWKPPHRLFSLGDGYVWEELKKYTSALAGDEGPASKDWATKCISLSGRGPVLELTVGYRSSSVSDHIGLTVTTTFDSSSFLPKTCNYEEEGVVTKAMTWEYDEYSGGHHVPHTYAFHIATRDSGKTRYRLVQKLKRCEFRDAPEPEVFTLTSLGIREGDRVDDHTNGSLGVWMNGKLEDSSKLPLDELVEKIAPQEPKSNRYRVFASLLIGVVSIVVWRYFVHHRRH